jgi:hypothetical protein
MGGYVGRAWLALSAHSSAAEPDDDDDGFDAYVFHDGDFPRDDTTTSFHHCSADQFRRLADVVDAARKGPR